jgi:hypothetical protein
MSERSNKLYPASYGAWAGFPQGHKPDYAHCCEEVTPNERGGYARRYQCQRKRGHGPDEAYCKQHDPDAAKKRQMDSQAKNEIAWQQRRYEISGKRFYDALVKIAEGHNDPRGLAHEIIDDFKGHASKADVT